MDLSKKDMEDIWHNKPFGYFSSIKKNLKGTKKYRIQVKPYTYNYLPEEIIEVRAKTVHEAQMKARHEYNEKHENLNPDGYWYSNFA